MTAEDLRLRFFAARKGLSHKFVARLTQIDYAHEMAFVAVTQSSGEPRGCGVGVRSAGELLGVSRLAADPDCERAEYAVMVRSDLKGYWLGWLLMQHLVAYARATGIVELFGSVLTENTTMLKMCRELGFDVTAESGAASERHVALKFAARPSSTNRRSSAT